MPPRPQWTQLLFFRDWTVQLIRLWAFSDPLWWSKTVCISKLVENIGDIEIRLIGYCLIWFRNIFVFEHDKITTPNWNPFNLRTNVFLNVHVINELYIVNGLNHQNRPGNGLQTGQLDWPFHFHGSERIFSRPESITTHSNLLQSRDIKILKHNCAVSIAIR